MLTFFLSLLKFSYTPIVLVIHTEKERKRERERKIYIESHYLVVMALEKALKDKKDFYSLRRRAAQDIQKWILDEVPEKTILLNLLTKYGFGEKFYCNILDLMVKEKREEN